MIVPCRLIKRKALMRYDDFIKLDDLKKYAAAMNLRARQHHAAGQMTAVLLRSLILDSGGKCAWCDAGLVKQEFEIDHVLALVQGGANTYANLAVTCVTCNRRKGDKSPLTFALEQVARNGVQTALIRRILDENDADAAHQPSLFGDE